MNNKKIIFGIILFLAICFLAFTFANPLESGNGEGTLIQGGENSTNNKNNDDGTEVKSISISGSVKNKIEIGESVNLNATIFPSTALDKKLTYTSSDSKVVSVDQNGVITGVGNGTATITISSGNGKNTTITITVGDDATVADNNQNNATNVNNNGNSGNNNYNRPTQSGGNNSGSSNNNNSGNNSGNNGGGNNGGNTTIPPTVDNTVQVSDINVKVNGNTKLVIGDKTSITSNVVPSNATTKTLTYTSSNNSVVQVDSSGNITAVGAGSATVTITANNGVSKTVTFNILGNSTSDVSVVSDNNSHITSTTSVSGNTVIVNLSGTLHVNGNGVGKSVLTAKVYVPSSYTTDILDKIFYRVGANGFGIDETYYSGINIINNKELLSSGGAYVSISIPFDDQTVSSTSKRISYYFDWLGLNSEIRYTFDFSNVTAIVQ